MKAWQGLELVDGETCVVHPSCPFVVVFLSMLWICDVTTIVLFSNHRRVPALKSTRVYVISSTSRRLVESARPLALYLTRDMKNSRSGYTRNVNFTRTETNICIPWCTY